MWQRAITGSSGGGKVASGDLTLSTTTVTPIPLDFVPKQLIVVFKDNPLYFSYNEDESTTQYRYYSNANRWLLKNFGWTTSNQLLKDASGNFSVDIGTTGYLSARYVAYG